IVAAAGAAPPGLPRRAGAGVSGGVCCGRILGSAEVALADESADADAPAAPFRAARRPRRAGGAVSAPLDRGPVPLLGPVRSGVPQPGRRRLPRRLPPLRQDGSVPGRRGGCAGAVLRGELLSGIALPGDGLSDRPPLRGRTACRIGRKPDATRIA